MPGLSQISSVQSASSGLFLNNFSIKKRTFLQILAPGESSRAGHLSHSLLRSWGRMFMPRPPWVPQHVGMPGERGGTSATPSSLSSFHPSLGHSLSPVQKRRERLQEEGDCPLETGSPVLSCPGSLLRPPWCVVGLSGTEEAEPKIRSETRPHSQCLER